MEFDDILTETSDGVLLITLHRPQALNALSFKTFYELSEAVRLADESDEVKCVVLTGSGRGFCAGLDMASSDETAQYRYLPARSEGSQRPADDFPEWLAACRKPLITAINGIAVGAGFTLALVGDIRIASEQARFSTIFTKRGRVVHAGLSYYLPRIVGTARALELIWSSEFVAAGEALATGIVSRVVPAEELLPAALEHAQRIASGPSIAINLGKQLVYDSLIQSLPDALRAEGRALTITSHSEDSQEGTRAFLEKRDPVFRGR